VCKASVMLGARLGARPTWPRLNSVSSHQNAELSGGRARFARILVDNHDPFTRPAVDSGTADRMGH